VARIAARLRPVTVLREQFEQFDSGSQFEVRYTALGARAIHVCWTVPAADPPEMDGWGLLGHAFYQWKWHCLRPLSLTPSPCQ
jgi:hypothetical protein